MSAHSWLMFVRMLTSCVLIAGFEWSSLSAQTRELSRAEQIQRSWRDASGLFVQEATLLELSTEMVKLRKGDGTIVDVRRELLSTADQNFLRELDKTRNPFMGGAVKETAPINVEKDSAGPKFSAGPSGMPAGVGPDQAFLSPDLPPILPSAQKVVIYSHDAS